MASLEVMDVHVVRRRDRRDPIDDRKLRQALRDGSWTKITAGAFVPTSEWSALLPLQQHRLRLAEVARRRHATVVFSHHAASAFWGMDVLGRWPKTIDVTVPTATGGRSSGLIRRHFADIRSLEVVPYGEHLMTSPAQTAVDLARLLPFENGVATVDQAVRRDREGGPLATRDEILELLHSSVAHRGDPRALRAIGFADAGAANVRESQLRVLVSVLGFPTPRTQERRLLRSGRLVFGDLFFPSDNHWLELDGRGKYTSPDFGADRDPAEIVIDEKNRENEIRREVRGFSRLEAVDCDHPARVYDILTGDGLPSALPRP